MYRKHSFPSRSAQNCFLPVSAAQSVADGQPILKGKVAVAADVEGVAGSSSVGQTSSLPEWSEHIHPSRIMN